MPHRNLFAVVIGMVTNPYTTGEAFGIVASVRWHTLPVNGNPGDDLLVGHVTGPRSTLTVPTVSKCQTSAWRYVVGMMAWLVFMYKTVIQHGRVSCQPLGFGRLATATEGAMPTVAGDPCPVGDRRLATGVV